jgi:hypothetical protein
MTVQGEGDPSDNNSQPNEASEGSRFKFMTNRKEISNQIKELFGKIADEELRKSKQTCFMAEACRLKLRHRRDDSIIVTSESLQCSLSEESCSEVVSLAASNINGALLIAGFNIIQAIEAERPSPQSKEPPNP